jgi:hypothetical protein
MPIIIDSEAVVPSGQDIANFLGQGDDQGLIALAEEHARIITAMVRAYTRGNGFAEDGNPTDELAAVITTATARLVANPRQFRQETAGPFSTTYAPFAGWTLAETFVLNRYRKRAL